MPRRSVVGILVAALGRRGLMFEKVDYEGLRRLLDEGAQRVEVLPAEEYVEQHLPAAINIPLIVCRADLPAG